MTISPDGKTITVSPVIFDVISDEAIALTIGHEMVHVVDTLAGGGILERGSLGQL